MKQTKAELRKQLRAWRAGLGKEEVEHVSSAITERLIKLISWHKVAKLHVYFPIPGSGEIDTKYFVQFVQSKYPGILLTIAKPERNQPTLADEDYDVVVVPVLGFTKDGHRLGYGGGWYDKFLATQPNALTIGLCYDESLVAFESEPHDISLKFIITESQTYQL